MWRPFPFEQLYGFYLAREKSSRDKERYTYSVTDELIPVLQIPNYCYNCWWWCWRGGMSNLESRPETPR